ncbi:PAS domain S-box-containing protein/diguanylate cyclase (GGDEF)-like protein [Roseibium hamelinense]|uniref:PAS domain S-box-containing protein/diguanylate cyclase (GGDEF)-like protein n=1 Tax=Roseibium hamelinense TaxID=150831 RepID=A0A562TAG0_9HYPH|nr:EAL domain-containing protein [Roseibium hamelinense]MTI45498.1 EAL domain-containing protein [Roseibium hamelinense]TWI90128.1 PAS domain S-box-containing protein/diguanylate cyclase (GGDEF)-like protein [Roseibium hamelinense]
MTQARLLGAANTVVFIIALLLLQTVNALAAPVERPGTALPNGDEVIAVVPANWPPQYSLNNKGEPQGFAIDVLDHLADTLGLTVRYVIAETFVDAIALLEQGEADLIPNSGIVPERLSDNLFTPPVETFRIVAFVRTGNVAATSAAALHGKQIGVVKRNAGLFLLRERKDLSLTGYDDAEHALLGLLSGAVNTVVYPDTVFNSLARSHGVADRITQIGTPLKEVPRGLHFNKDRTDLHALFSSAVAAFVYSPAYQQIYTKWYGQEEPYWTEKRVHAAMLSAMIVLIMGFFLWRFMMLREFYKRLTISQQQLIHLNETLEIRVKKRTEELSREVDERKRSQNDLEAFFNQPQSLNLIVDFNGNILRHNGAWSDLLDYSSRELVSRPFIQLVHPQDVEETLAVFSKLRDGEAVDGFVNRYYCRCGIYKDLRWSARSDIGRQLVYAVAIDITREKNAEDALKLSASVFTSADEGILSTDASGTILDVNAAFTEITGYDRSDVLGSNASVLNSGKQDTAFYNSLWETLQTTGMWRGEIWNRKKTGEVYPEMLTISAVEDKDGNVTNYIGLFSDISKLKAHEKQLEHLARYDKLTGLPNRVLLEDQMSQAMARARRHGHYMAIAFIDLDGFKTVNDTHGHAAGDELLVAMAKRLRSVLRTEDTLARIGGDEFVALITDLPSQTDCIGTLDRLLSIAAQEFNLEKASGPAAVSASIGVSFFPQDLPMEADQLERQADQAMYEAKLAGRNRYRFFDPLQDQQLACFYARIEDAGDALKNDQFQLFYQPKVDLESGEVIGCEALLRWQHPVRGLLSPADFLPPVEKHAHFALPLGDWVMETALKQIAAWQETGLDFPVSINASALQIASDDFEIKLRSQLGRYPEISPGKLEIELLETDAIKDFDHVSNVIRSCRDLGVTFAIDDFGTGYSSLAYLKQLPVNTLKIDQGFVRDSVNNPQDQEILKLIISFGQVFDLKVLAEGVETVAHAELLKTHGCRYAQGYAFAKPMPAAAVERWYRTWESGNPLGNSAPRRASAN